MSHTVEAHADLRPARAALGTYAKSITPPRDQRKIRGLRAERFELLSAARTLLLGRGHSLGLEHPHNYHRTAKCKWITHGGSVGVHASQEHASAFYSGLVTCGSVWSCPVCAAKVQERRREEIATAIDWAYTSRLQPVMVTLTFPHHQWHKLSNLLEQQATALQRLRAGGPWRRLRERAGYRGLIRSLELTHGDNGWHPHTHELWLVGAHVEADELREQILQRWKSSCARAGLLDLDDPAQVAAFEAHSVDVRGWCTASDYLAKQDDSRHWGVDRELAKASSKRGRKAGRHPFGLLADAAGGDGRAGRLYVEYADCMKGRRQLFWSAGLKDLVGLTELSDEELAEEERDSADLLGLLDQRQWRLVREAGQRAQLLDAAEVGGWPAVLTLLNGLSGTRSGAPTGSSDVPVAAPEPEPPVAPAAVRGMCCGFGTPPAAHAEHRPEPLPG